jgi:hypothetical protein
MEYFKIIPSPLKMGCPCAATNNYLLASSYSVKYSTITGSEQIIPRSERTIPDKNGPFCGRNRPFHARNAPFQSKTDHSFGKQAILDPFSEEIIPISSRLPDILPNSSRVNNYRYCLKAAGCKAEVRSAGSRKKGTSPHWEVSLK